MARSCGVARVVTAVAVAVIVLAGCATGSSTSPAHRIPAHRAEVLGRGVVHGKKWVLRVFSNPEGNLCMGVNGQLPLRVQQHADVVVEGGCGFGPFGDRDSAPFDEAETGGYTLTWGPAPSGAVRVRLDTFHQKAEPAPDASAMNVPGCRASTPAHLWVRITHRLPGWTEPGGWFITHIPSAGCGYLDATFYDRNGGQVAEHWW